MPDGTPAAATCPRCRAPLGSGDRFCTSCGQELQPPEPDRWHDDPAPAPWTTAGASHAAWPEPAPRTQAEPAPWAPAASLGGPPARRPGVVALWVLAAAAVLAGAGYAGVALGRGDSPSAATVAAPAAARQSPSPAASPSTPASPSHEASPDERPTATPSPADVQAAAAASLQRRRAVDAARVPLGGQWAAQLASKYDGIVDESQTSASGSHVFSSADILAETERLRSLEGGSVTTVLLLSTDYGSRRTFQGQPLWVTFAVGPFGSSADVQQWCEARFAGLSGHSLSNVCTPRRLDPPS